MQQLYQDGMAIVRKLGKADLFVTFTCNPKWPEIQKELLPGQTANDRPDQTSFFFLGTQNLPILGTRNGLNGRWKFFGPI